MDLNLICSFYLGLWPLLWCLNFVMQKTIFWIICLLSAIPLVQAAPSESSFPDVKFEIFAKTIKTIFHSDISLATILVLVFTMIENSDFINLNAHRQSPIHANEGLAKVSPWLTTLAQILKVELGSDRFNTLFTPTEQTSQLNELSELKLISKKLDHLIKALNLYSVNEDAEIEGTLLPISHKTIQPIHIICPNTAACQTCATPWALSLNGAWRDVPTVTLIKNNTVFDNAYVVSGTCPKCDTKYYADHHRISAMDPVQRIFLNSAKYVKLGQSLWADRKFSHSVVAGMYQFHASAFTQYWNTCYGVIQTNKDITTR